MGRKGEQHHVEGQLSTQAGIWEGEWEFHAHGHTWCTSTLLAYLFTLYRVLFYGNEAVFADTHTHTVICTCVWPTLLTIYTGCPKPRL